VVEGGLFPHHGLDLVGELAARRGQRRGLPVAQRRRPARPGCAVEAAAQGVEQRVVRQPVGVVVEEPALPGGGARAVPRREQAGVPGEGRFGLVGRAVAITGSICQTRTPASARPCAKRAASSPMPPSGSEVGCNSTPAERSIQALMPCSATSLASAFRLRDPAAGARRAAPEVPAAPVRTARRRRGSGALPAGCTIASPLSLTQVRRARPATIRGGRGPRQRSSVAAVTARGRGS
jgi:hypothetical protein